MAHTDAVVCLITTPPADAERIASAAVDAGVAACVNIVPLVRSVYRWEGAVQTDEEALLVVKSTRCAVPEIERLLAEVHPYETFELVALDVAGGSDTYLEWIAQAVVQRM